MKRMTFSGNAVSFFLRLRSSPALVFFALMPLGLVSQVSHDSALFRQLESMDSTFFERGFNRCDLDYLRDHIADDLRFYHDQGGFQDKLTFFENTRQYICPDSGAKPIRKLDPESLEVFPLYNDGVLYGAIQTGIHHFYLREPDKEDIRTSTARFTHVWLLEDDVWKLNEVLSYDHQTR